MNSESDCVFCEIVAGRAPSSKVYEDDTAVAFMGIYPINAGECIVIPKMHVDHFEDLPDDIACHLLKKAKEIARKLMEELQPKRVGFTVTGFGVPHAHMLVIPLYQNTDVTSSKYVYLENGEVKYSEKQIPLADRSELDTLAKRLNIKPND